MADYENYAGEIFTVATCASSLSSGTVKLLLPGETTASSKYYKVLNNVGVSNGARVVCVKMSGTWVVLGSFNAGGGGGGSNAGDVAADYLADQGVECVARVGQRHDVVHHLKPLLCLGGSQTLFAHLKLTEHFLGRLGVGFFHDVNTPLIWIWV